MTRSGLLFAVSAGTTVTALAWIVLQPPRRLAAMVRPYTQVARSRLLRDTDPHTYLTATTPGFSIRTLVQPVIDRLISLQSRLIGPRSDDALATRLRQSGLYPGLEPAQRLATYRFRSLATSAVAAVALGVAGWSSAGPAGMVVYAAGGIVAGSLISKGRVDRAVRTRGRVMAAELYTINQILAMRARAGGGVTDALRHVADRSTGIIATEIRDTLALHRTGVPITAALRRTAASTAQPEAARLYQALAIGHERGVDLADSLLALARDLRVDRRHQAVTRAASRRIAAVVPIVVILAPITIAFLAAPLPSLIFGAGP